MFFKTTVFYVLIRFTLSFFPSIHFISSHTYSIFNTEFRDAFRRILVRYVFSSETMSQTCNHICKNPCRSSATSATTTAAIDKKQSLSLTTTKILNIDHESERKNIQSKIKEEDDNNVNNRHSFQQQQQFSNNKNIVETLSFKSSTSLNDITSSKRINDNDVEDNQSLRADTKHIDNDEKQIDRNKMNGKKLKNFNEKSIMTTSTSGKESNRHHRHHQQKQRRHNHNHHHHLYNSYSVDHCCSITKLDNRKIDSTTKTTSPTTSTKLPNYHHNLKMSSESDINLALNQQQQQQNHQCKPDSSSMMIPMEKFSFDV